MYVMATITRLVAMTISNRHTVFQPSDIDIQLRHINFALCPKCGSLRLTLWHYFDIHHTDA